MIVNIQELIGKGVSVFFIRISSEENFNILMKKIESLGFFRNDNGFLERNSYVVGSKKIIYLFFNLFAKEISFSRAYPSQETSTQELFIDELSDFSIKGKRKKIQF
jgi:hypothetical protein